MASIQLYNHVARDVLGGDNSKSHTYKLMLLNSTAVFNPTHELLSSVSSHEVTGTGWSAGGFTLTGAVVALVTTNDATLSFDNVEFVVQDGGLGPFRSYVIYNSSRTGNPLIGMATLASDITIPEDTTFEINWSDDHVLKITVS
jgi:hypothetical protein